MKDYLCLCGHLESWHTAEDVCNVSSCPCGNYQRACIRCHVKPVMKYPSGRLAMICEECFLKAFDQLILTIELHDENS